MRQICHHVDMNNTIQNWEKYFISYFELIFRKKSVDFSKKEKKILLDIISREKMTRKIIQKI